MARKLYPMPVQGILEHPDFIAMPAAGAGILFRLTLHYWQTGCRDLPKADHDLRAITRAHLATWSQWKAHVLRVFADVAPELARYHHERITKATTIKILANRGGGARAAQSARDRLAASAPPLTPITDAHQLGFVPKREPAPARPPAPDARPPRPIRTDTLTRR
jgi:hypothetical protein